MRVIWTPGQLERFLAKAARVSPEYPVVINKFIRDALEVEVDAISDGKVTFIGAIIEHVEKAGVHSGDAVMFIPSKTLRSSTKNVLIDYTTRIAQALKIKGPFNTQFVVKDGRVYVIECNLRASRSMPFVSKLMGINLMEIAASAIIGKRIEHNIEQHQSIHKVGVKVPQFSFMQLEGADPNLGVEMQSTGEVACFGENFYDALIKAFNAAGYRLPRPHSNILVTVGGPLLKKRILPLVRDLQKLGFNIIATDHTADFLIKNGYQNITVLHKISEPNLKPNLQDYLIQERLDLIINIPATTVLEKYAKMLEDEYLIRRKAVELGVPVLTTFETAKAFIQGLAWLRTNKHAVSTRNH